MLEKALDLCLSSPSFVPSLAVLPQAEPQTPKFFGLFLQPPEPANLNQSRGGLAEYAKSAGHRAKSAAKLSLPCALLFWRIESPETIKGFASRESAYQEALKKLLEVPNKTPEQRTVQDKEDEKNSKKIKLSTPYEKAEFEIALLVFDISDKYKGDALQDSKKLLHLILMVV